MQGAEKQLGEWRQSKASVQFWLLAIFTLGLYVVLVYNHNSISLTSRRVTQKRGNILTSNETSISLENITNIDVNISFLGRILGYGDLKIQTAGADTAEINATRLERPEQLREAIFDLRDGRLDETKLPR